MFNKIQAVCVLLACGAAAMGCAVESEAPAVAQTAQELTSTYDGISVVGVRDADGTVRVEPRGARGEALLTLRVRGDRMEIEPHDGSLAPWSGSVPVDVATANDLTDWNYLAYVYAQHVALPSAPSEVGGQLHPSMMSAGTNGQMCIAAGGSAMECAAWLYCSKHWCPFW